MVAGNDFSATEFRKSLKANPNTFHQVWWSALELGLGLYSNPGLYNPWVWSNHIEALDQATFVDVGWSLDGGVCCPCLHHSAEESGVKRWCCIIHHYSCVL